MSLCGRDCSHCTMQIHCQGCSLCEYIFCDKQCRRCFSLCPSRAASYPYLMSLGGGKVELKKNKIDELPSFIPVLPDRFPVRTKTQEIIGVHGGNMLCSNGENVAKVYRKKGLQEVLNLNNPVKGVLQFYVKDRAIEGFWDNRRELYKQLQEFPWAAIIAPNFSVYEDAPRIDHLYNIKRSNVIYNELLEQELPAVPDISWYNRIDLDQWIREINDSGIKTIAYSFQTVSTATKAANIWRHYLMGYEYLMKNIPEDVNVIIAGLSSPERLRFVRMAGKGKNRISVLNQTAYVKSRRGQLAEKEERGMEGELTKEQIFKRNVDFYRNEYIKLGLEGEKGAKIEK